MMKAGGRERGEWPWGGYTFVDLGLALLTAETFARSGVVVHKPGQPSFLVCSVSWLAVTYIVTLS